MVLEDLERGVLKGGLFPKRQKLVVDSMRQEGSCEWMVLEVGLRECD